MAKKLQLSIAEPCHENWENMSPVEKGKFCGSCQKQVIDFSYMNDRQIAEFFKKPATGSVCGRFMSDQLDRPIDIPRKRIPWFRYFFQLMLPAFFISKVSAQQKIGKVKPAERDTTRIPIDHEFRTLGMVLPTNIKPVCKDTTDDRLIKGEITTIQKKVERIAVNGQVVDESGQPVAGATVRIINSGKMIAANDAGKFAFHSTRDQLIELEITSTGYQAEQYIYPFTLQYSSIVDITVQLKAQSEQLPEIIVVSTMCISRKAPRMIMGYTTVSAPEEINQVQKDSADVNELSKFLVYPNPVTPGTTINISFSEPEEGYYSLKLLALSGQVVNHKEIWIDKQARVLNMEAPSVAAGSYFLVLVNKKSGKKFSAKIIIL